MSDDLPPFPDAGHLGMESGDGICDFCNPPGESKWIYPCKNFLLPDEMQRAYREMFGRDGISEGGWGACDRCSQLIEAGNYDELARMALVNPHQRKVIALFEKHRFGQRIPANNHISIRFDNTIVYPL